MKKAFTLVELLIVIGIIALLSGVLMISMSGGTEAARSAQCLTNMRGLAAACVAYASSSKYYPCAGSVEKSQIDESKGIGKGQRKYYELAGWLSWNSDGAYPSTSTKQPDTLSMYSTSVSTDEQKLRDYAITNGAIRASLVGNRDILVCPMHKIDKKSLNPFYSYVMNEYFYWNNDGKVRSEHFHGRLASTIGHADRLLLFAEINFKGYVGEVSESTSGTDTDPILQYDSNNECIGFNHTKGKEKYAHVAFADGHTEQLLLPKGGLSDADLKELTKLLCEGKDVALQDNVYKEMN